MAPPCNDVGIEFPQPQTGMPRVLRLSKLLYRGTSARAQMKGAWTHKNFWHGSAPWTFTSQYSAHWGRNTYVVVDMPELCQLVRSMLS
jgi:hypothetical protein